MRLSRDWKRIVKHSASFRLLVLAALLTGAEAALPFFGDIFGFGARGFAALTFFIVAGALVARVVAQKAFEEADDEPT